MGGRGWARWSRVKGGKWDNCNSIINKFFFSKKKLPFALGYTAHDWQNPNKNPAVFFLVNF